MFQSKTSLSYFSALLTSIQNLMAIEYFYYSLFRHTIVLDSKFTLVYQCNMLTLFTVIYTYYTVIISSQNLQ